MTSRSAKRLVPLIDFISFAATCIPDCLNGGTCVNSKCVCAKGYLGPNCNIGEDRKGF